MKDSATLSAQYTGTQSTTKKITLNFVLMFNRRLIKWRTKTKDCTKILMTVIVVVILFNKMRLTKQYKTCHYDSMTM